MTRYLLRVENFIKAFCLTTTGFSDENPILMSGCGIVSKKEGHSSCNGLPICTEHTH